MLKVAEDLADILRPLEPSSYASCLQRDEGTASSEIGCIVCEASTVKARKKTGETLWP